METSIALHSVAHRVSREIWPGLLPDLRAYQGCARVFFPDLFCTKHKKTRRRCPGMAPFFFRAKARLRATLVISPSEKFPQNQTCRAKIALHPPKASCRTFLRTPPVALSSHSQQARGAAGWWRVSRHLWVPKTDRATGGSQLQSHQSRYSVQLRWRPG